MSDEIQKLTEERDFWRDRFEMVSRAYMRLEVEYERLGDMLDQSECDARGSRHEA